MKPGRVLVAGALALIAMAMAWLLFVTLPRRFGKPSAVPAAATVPAATTAASPGRRIKAHLYYVSDDGAHLAGVERDVPFGETTVEQARQIVEAQIAPVADPLVSAIPPGTTLRALFVTDTGEAYVDLSREAAAAHGGGSLDELLTVYTIVDVLTTNLPAVSAVQLLVDGKEVDTLAGHVDLRRPLAKNLEWIQ